MSDAVILLETTSRQPESGAGGWFVYIAECSDATLYTGITTDLIRRIATHNAGSGARYTRSRRPITLVYSEPAQDRSAALRREYAIKKLPASAKRALISE